MNKSIDNTINTLLARSTTRAAWCYQQGLEYINSSCAAFYGLNNRKIELELY
jgi:hypothetical protein